MIVNDENIPTTSAGDGKVQFAPSSAVKRAFGTVVSSNNVNIGVSSTAVTPKKKLSVRDLAKSFQGTGAVPMPAGGLKTTNVALGRHRASSLPGMIIPSALAAAPDSGIYPFSKAAKVIQPNSQHQQHQYQGRTRAFSQYDSADTAVASNGLVSPTSVRTSSTAGSDRSSFVSFGNSESGTQLWDGG